MKPKELFVFGEIIPVKYIEFDDHWRHASGLYDPNKKIIYIDKNIDKKIINQTIIHELGHALFARTGLNQAVTHEVEEIIVENFSTAICENFNLRIR